MEIIENAGNMAASCLETACQFTIGQFFVRMLDRSIGVVEKTAQWSLPRHEIISDENGKSFRSVELVRPLPWILFLPGLVILRGIRFTWNIGGFIIGYPEIHPGDIVTTLQTVRRRLRTIRMNGVKRMRKIRPANNREQSLGLNDAKQSLLRSIQLTLSTLSCFDASKMKSSPPPTRIRVPMSYDQTPALDEKSTIESTAMTQQQLSESKRKYSEVSSDDPASNEESENDEMSFNSKLSHYALLNSSDDPDFDSKNCTAETNDLEESIEHDDDCDEDDVNSLIEEARQTLMEEYKKSNPEMFGEQTPVVTFRSPMDEKSTARNGNCMNKTSDELQDYYSPCKSIEDADTAFYSPISSKSTSPEREVTAHDVGIVQKTTGKHIVVESESSTIITNNVEDINHTKNNKHETAKKNDEQNDLLGVKGKQQRENPKGKRNTHGNRKKK